MKFYTALSEKQIISFKKSDEQKKYDKKLSEINQYREDQEKIIHTFSTAEYQNVEVKFYENNLAFFHENKLLKFLSDDDIRNLILNLIKIDEH